MKKADNPKKVELNSSINQLKARIIEEDRFETASENQP
jgi:hypothetical protein